ncbi:hypothetical protein M878_39120 [Streptomyces roseochromogenus subsp. oscitans DS 12.976]|uniref:Uncharacterized protein n=1 Tax=Streptomyces roseochromogenus subsp. oscitans DS 12.976 TaxID=1352936 RepID=V6JLP7_STRRC|nr:hypothetical protein M878_39120 [Streptomyces roseochromogenus subsp. oscitans DS 12.976]
MERAEIDRLRAQEGHPETLRDRVRVVGTTEGAELMEIPAGRFTRLARLGLLVPVKWYLNRYRAVVWLYLAEDLRAFASDAGNAHLLKGRTPENLRGQLEAGVDLRARNWRGRHLGFLLRQVDEPWARAGAVAAFLSPVEIADIVRDPYERAYLNRFRPAPPGQGTPGSPAAYLAERITTAQDADEIAWLRSELAQVLDEARALAQAPRPAARRLVPTPRATARPIPPMAVTVTRTTAPTARASSAPGEEPVAACAPELLPGTPGPTTGPVAGTSGPDGGRLPGSFEPTDEPVTRAFEWHGTPLVPQAAPTTVRRGRRRAESPSPRTDRGLRAWLRRRSTRPSRV